ncbi:hypothetical protein F5Y07DRAFT_409660 [Xylaria sp. FL0933]|nr:hypothetical protein F5Y07DRAFT_409660 [Xylaria sp. FL0933]
MLQPDEKSKPSIPHPNRPIRALWNMENLAPYPEKAPQCQRCGQVTTLHITGSSNRNGNAGRPYYKCSSCIKFCVFKDLRGNDPTNPKYHCGHSSKRQISGRSKQVAGRVHYVCRLGTCDYFSPGRDEEGADIIVNEEISNALSRLYII